MICRSNNIYIYIYIENVAIPHIIMSDVDAAQIKRD